MDCPQNALDRIESFVFSEITKLMGASDMHLTPYHFRDQEMHEVDIVLERDDGARDHDR
jgi:uncharacterized protein